MRYRGGVDVVEEGGRGGAAGTEVRCGGGGGIVRGECGGTVAVAKYAGADTYVC